MDVNLAPPVFRYWAVALAASLSILFSFHAHAQSDRSGHAWEFEVQRPGAYELQVEHRVGVGIPLPPSLRAEYIIETKEQPFARLMAPIENQRFAPLTANVASPQRIRVIIAGLPRRILDQTRVYVFEVSAAPSPSVTSFRPGPFNDDLPAPSKRQASADVTFSKEVEQLLTLPENKIDVGIAALTLAKEIYPEIDVAAYSKRIDDLAEEVKRLANNPTDPEIRIRALNTVLHLYEDYRYDHSPNSRENLDNLFLNRYLDRRRGSCITMPLLYVAVGQRLGYPIYPVVAPDHMFVRYADPDFDAQNIEATSGGKYFPDEFYIKDFSVSEKGRLSGSYLRTMTRRELLGQLLAGNAVVYGKQGRILKAVKYLEKAIELDPKFADHYEALEASYRTLAKIHSERESEYRAKAAQYGAKAKALGLVTADVVNLGRNTRGL